MVVSGFASPAQAGVQKNTYQRWIPAGVYPVLDAGREWTKHGK